MKYFLSVIFIAIVFCCDAQNKKDSNLIKANAILESVYKNYSAPGTNLLRENFPYDDKYTPDYLAANPGTQVPNPHAFLWPYSGTLSAASALLEATGDKRYKKLLDEKILPGLEEYFDVKRQPYGYASYINSAKPSDRFYDDNIWLGIDFTDLYRLTNEKNYLDKAKLIWDFVWSGYDNKLDGGIYWCEQKKTSKNTCSNAPAAVFAFKLFGVTNDRSYFNKGKDIYDWTKRHLQDSIDGLYFDNVSLNGNIDKRKYAYNSGQMLQASVLLFKITGEEFYLSEAKRIAASARSFFTRARAEGDLRIFRDNNIWFNAVMLRGFADLYEVTRDAGHLEYFQSILNGYYNNLRDENGLFMRGPKRKWLLDQAGFAEMFARLSYFDQIKKQR